MAINFEKWLKIERFELIIISNKFLEIIREVPEASTAKEVVIGTRKIKGPEVIFVASSMEEIIVNLPDIISSTATTENHHLRVIHRQGSCHRCEARKDGKPVIECPHLKEIVTLNKLSDLDVQKYLKLETNSVTK